MRWASRSAPGTEYRSPPLHVRRLEWRCVLIHDGGHLSLFLHCTHPDGDSLRGWKCTASAKLVIKQQRRINSGWEREETDGMGYILRAHTFHSSSPDWGVRSAAKFIDLLDYGKDYLCGDGVDGALRMEVRVEAGEVEEQSVSLTYTIPDPANFINNNESIRSEQSVELCGSTFRIGTDVRYQTDDVIRRAPVGENIPLDKKWLGFYLCCNTDEDDCLISSYPWERCVSIVLRLLVEHNENEENLSDEPCWRAYVKRFTHEEHKCGSIDFALCEQLLNVSTTITLQAEIWPMSGKSYEQIGLAAYTPRYPYEHRGPMTLRELSRLQRKDANNHIA